MSFLQSLRRLLASPPSMEPEDLAARLQAGTAPRIIDVREPDEFRAGHIPGAQNIPLSQLPGALGRLRPTEEIVLVCRSGNRSRAAQRFLAAQGFDRAINLTGGMLRWTGPVVR